MDLITLQRAANRTRPMESLPPPEQRAELRRNAGVAELTLAAAVGVSLGAVRRWERGQDPKIAAHDERYRRCLALLDRDRTGVS